MPFNGGKPQPSRERDVTCSQHSSNQGIGYQPEMWTVPKDAIYAAIEALRLAIGYMPQIKTDVPQWQATLDQDLIKMQCAISELRSVCIVITSRQR